jgi:hypothetical protein
MSFTKPSNLSATKAYQDVAPAAADITFAAGAIGFAGVGETARIIRINSQSTKAFSAGVKQVNAFDFAAIVATSNTVYTMGIRRFDTGQVITYQIITPSTAVLAADIAEAFRAIITADLTAVVTVVRVGTINTYTERSTDTGGLAFINPTGVVVSGVPTAHVDPSGTLAEVQVYDPSVTAGDYRKYTIAYDKEVAAPAGGKWFVEVQMIIWANELDVVDEAAFLAKFNEVMTASNVVAATQPYVEVV